MAYYHAKLKALRDNLMARNVHRLAGIADDSKNDMARVTRYGRSRPDRLTLLSRSIDGPAAWWNALPDASGGDLELHRLGGGLAVLARLVGLGDDR
jgi:hypothetical protein